MTIPKTGAGAVVALVLLIAGLLAALPGAPAGVARAAEKGTWQDLVLLYTSDIKGKIEPCG